MIFDTVTHRLQHDQVDRTSEFIKWVSDLGDDRAKAKIALRIDQFALGNPGDIKPVEGVTEMRIDFGPGYRVYYGKAGRSLRFDPVRWNQAEANERHQERQKSLRRLEESR